MKIKTKPTKLKAKLIYNRTIKQMVEQRSLEKGGRVQKYVDSTVLRLSDPYVPFLTGMLKTSGIRGTILGSGEVDYIVPYARVNYYNNRGRGKQGTARGGIRGKMWFHRMKADHLGDIINGAAKVAGGKGIVRK